MNDTKMKRKVKMVVKGISNGRFSGELGWKIVQQFMSEEPMNCFGELSNKFASDGCPIHLPYSIVSFREQKYFVLKTLFCSHLA